MKIYSIYTACFIYSAFLHIYNSYFLHKFSFTAHCLLTRNNDHWHFVSRLVEYKLTSLFSLLMNECSFVSRHASWPSLWVSSYSSFCWLNAFCVHLLFWFSLYYLLQSLHICLSFFCLQISFESIYFLLPSILYLLWFCFVSIFSLNICLVRFSLAHFYFFSLSQFIMYFLYGFIQFCFYLIPHLFISIRFTFFHFLFFLLVLLSFVLFLLFWFSFVGISFLFWVIWFSYIFISLL